MFYVISDLHGYPHERFLRLLSLAGFGRDDFLYILGDVIDRNGDGGVATLEWLLYQPNVQLLLGNHEAALLACSFVFDEIKEGIEEVLTSEKLEILMRYLADGGQVTLSAMHALSHETRDDILEYLRDCPYYELIGVGDKNFLLVHSGIDNFVLGKKLTEYPPEDFLWARPALSDRYYDDVMTVFGHTPTVAYGDEYSGKIIKTPTWINIDQGAGSGREPVLLRLDDMNEFRLE